MLLLIYVLLSCYLTFFSLSFEVYAKIQAVLLIKSITDYEDLVLFSAFMLTGLLTVTITLFFKFHVRLVLTNSTTIESMDKKNLQKDVYNKGIQLNWVQVFGRNKWLWMFPVTGISGKPIGDGVIWTQENNHVEDEIPDNENDIRKSLTLSGTGNIAQILAKENSKTHVNPQLRPKEPFKTLEPKKKEENDTKPSSMESMRFAKSFNENLRPK
jgi:palmitoyltransferase ZDHHC2/15/20